jgi:hypothetical protein
MTAFPSHPQRNSIRLQLRQNQLLQGLSPAQWSELEPLLAVADYRKGEPLVRQGDEEMEQFFILEGMLKRVVSNPEGRWTTPQLHLLRRRPRLRRRRLRQRFHCRRPIPRQPEFRYRRLCRRIRRRSQ